MFDRRLLGLRAGSGAAANVPRDAAMAAMACRRLGIRGLALIGASEYRCT
jgi:hypothetical protein